MQLCRKRAAAKLSPLSRNWLISTNRTWAHRNFTPQVHRNHTLSGTKRSIINDNWMKP